MKLIWRKLIFIISISHLLNFQTMGQDKSITRIESVQSLYLETFKDDKILGKATGFIIKSKTKNYLITNWHVATNKNPKTKKWIDPKIPISPNKIKILQNSTILGNHIAKEEILVDSKGNIMFKQFEINKEMVDVVAIPLSDTIGIKIYPVNYKSTYEELLLMPTDRVFVLGFPLGFVPSPAFAIWKSGLIASEPDLDQEGKPIIWVDMFGYGGMSGSPVYLITDKLKYKNGDSVNLIGGSQTFFLGVFSHGEPKIGTGALWKSLYLKKLFESLE